MRGGCVALQVGKGDPDVIETTRSNVDEDQVEDEDEDEEKIGFVTGEESSFDLVR